MIIAGFLLIPLGAICSIAGYFKLSSLEYQFMAAFDSAGPGPMILIIGGILMVVIGIVLLLAGYSERKTRSHMTPLTDPILPYIDPAVTPANDYVPQVICVKGYLAGASYPIGGGRLTIGRDPVRCQVALPQSQQMVSRLHCEIDYNPISDVFVIRDLYSVNGTYLLNGTKVSGNNPVALKRGDRFYVADKSNVFEVR